MALNYLSELYLTPNPVQHQVNQPSIDEFLDKNSYRWKQLRRVMRTVADRYRLAGLKDPKCDEAVRMVLNNVPDMQHLVNNIESCRKLALLMVKNRAERVRKTLIRKGGPRIYKRKINQKERKRWDAMRNRPSNKEDHTTTPEANQRISSLVGETSRILYGDRGLWQQDSPTHQTPWTTPETPSFHSPPIHSPSVHSPSSNLSGMSTPRPRRRSVSRSPPSLELLGRLATPSPTSVPIPSPSSSISSPHTISENDSSPTPKKGWKGWALAENEEDLIPQKKFKPKSGQRTRKPRRVLDL